MAIKYVIIKDLKVNRAHALQGEFILSPPSVCTWGGFVSYLEEYSNGVIKNEGFNVSYLKIDIEKSLYQFNKNKSIEEQSNNSANYGLNIGKMETACIAPNAHIINNNNVLKSASIKIVPKVNFWCHLVICIRTELNNNVLKDIIRRFLQYDVNIGGGMISSYSNICVFEEEEVLTTNKFRIFKLLSEGWMFIDNSRELEQYCNTYDVDSLVGMLRFLKHTHYQDGTTKFTDYIPQTVGYVVIQSYEGNITRDETIPNYFCENLITVCKKIRINKNYNINNVLWKYNVEDGKEYKYIMKEYDNYGKEEH